MAKLPESRMTEHRQTTSASVPAHRLAELFNPRSVAIVGASDNNNMSLCAWRNLQRHDFSGRVHFVNPNQREVHGVRAVRSLSDIDEPVDAVMSLVGAARVPALMKEAAACGIRNLVVVSGGFAEESGHGAALQSQVLELCGQNGQLVLGPNTIGFLNLHGKAVLYGSPLDPPSYSGSPVPAGPIGAIVQSGIVAHTLVRGAVARQVGFSTIAALGNEMNVRIHDLIDHLVRDEHTRVIALFIETVRDHQAFRAACVRALEAGKPIVAMRAGRSAVGAKTAVSHTGALAGDDQVNEAAFRQLGIVCVNSIEELIVTCGYLANHGAPRGMRAAFVSVSGGFCEMFADRAEMLGIEVPTLAPATQSALREILPSSAMVMNPIDTTGVAQSDRTLFPRVMDIVARDPNLDILFVSHNQWQCAPADEAALIDRYRPWGDVIRRSPVPLQMLSDHLTSTTDFEQRFERETGIPPEVGGVWFGLQAFAHAAAWRSRRASILTALQDPPPKLTLVGAPLQSPLAEFEVLKLLCNGNVPVIPWDLARDRDAAISAARRFGFPVVLKVSSAQIPHKSAAGGVALNLSDDDAVNRAWDRITAAVAAVPDAVVDGMLVMPMRPSGLELIVGVKHDATWGHALVIGMGGVWTEVLSDTVVCTLPASAADVREALQRLRGAKLLAGGHGLQPADMDRLVEVILRVARLGQSLGEDVEALEINPLKVDGSRIEALDGLVVWKADAPGQTPV